MQGRLDIYLARHCAPTLLGAKAASLVSLPYKDFPDLPQLAKEYTGQYAACGLAFLPLCECKQRRLLLVYRPASLKNSLSAPQAAAILRGFGYDTGQGLDGMLAALRGRFAGACGFPHEIGLFLDYPPKDVQAFIETGGEGCKLCGYWKVYHDVEAARERFACFDACRACLGRMLAAGNTISQLLCAA